MARVTGNPHATDTTFWPVDKVILAYFTFTGLLIVGWWHEVPDAWQHLLGHLVAIAIIVYEVKRPNLTSWMFRNWYPLPFVASCYKEMALFIPAIRTWTADRTLADLDFRIWGANPTVWLERVHTPALTEFLAGQEKQYIDMVLHACNGDKPAAAKVLGIEVSKLG